MISRLTAFAATFAVAIAGGLAITAGAHTPTAAAAVVPVAPAAKTVRIVELPRVVVVARRLDPTAP